MDRILHILVMSLLAIKVASAKDKMYIDGRWCYGITCMAGEEPVVCHKGDMFSATCRPCPWGTFNPGVMDLGDRCRIKTTCNGEYMIVADAGSRTTDTVCDCQQGYRLSRYVHKCYKPPTETTTTERTTSSSTTTKAERGTVQAVKSCRSAPIISYIILMTGVACCLATM